MLKYKCKYFLIFILSCLLRRLALDPFSLSLSRNPLAFIHSFTLLLMLWHLFTVEIPSCQRLFNFRSMSLHTYTHPYIQIQQILSVCMCVNVLVDTISDRVWVYVDVLLSILWICISITYTHILWYSYIHAYVCIFVCSHSHVEVSFFLLSKVKHGGHENVHKNLLKLLPLPLPLLLLLLVRF